MTVPIYKNNIDQFVIELSNWYKTAGQNNYDEVVTISDHMLQAASIAYDEGLSNSNILSCLFHDIGHMIIDDLDIDAWMNELKINAVIPIILARKLKSNLQMGLSKKIVFISSQMGSIDDNYSGRFYFYRSSKSALNSAAKSLSIDWKEDGISILILHPGWVKTDMGGDNAKLEIPDSISQMIKVINDLNLTNSGSFVNYTGEKLEW